MKPCCLPTVWFTLTVVLRRFLSLYGNDSHCDRAPARIWFSYYLRPIINFRQAVDASGTESKLKKNTLMELILLIGKYMFLIGSNLPACQKKLRRRFFPTEFRFFMSVCHFNWFLFTSIFRKQKKIVIFFVCFSFKSPRHVNVPWPDGLIR